MLSASLNKYFYHMMSYLKAEETVYQIVFEGMFPSHFGTTVISVFPFY